MSFQICRTFIEGLHKNTKHLTLYDEKVCYFIQLAQAFL
jgi:hypothetical protein